ncbi:MAG: transporter associated domain-containing protein [Nocardioidaceae bacterium]
MRTDNFDQGGRDGALHVLALRRRELVRRPDTREVGVRDFEDETGLVLPEGPYETVAGYIVQQLGHVPAVGEAARFAGHTFTVRARWAPDRSRHGRRLARLGDIERR